MHMYIYVCICIYVYIYIYISEGPSPICIKRGDKKKTSSRVQNPQTTTFLNI